VADADRFTREYSSRLGLLSGAQLQAALDRFDLGRLRDASPAKGGFSGQNVFLTATSGEYVLRGAPHSNFQFAKERFFARLIEEESVVPAPWPYLVEPATDLFGWSYAIMPRLPGLQIAELEALPEEERQRAAYALGVGLAELHAITRPERAEYDLSGDGLKPRRDPQDELTMWSWWGFEQSAEDLIAKCVTAEIVLSEDAAWARRIIGDNAEALKVPFTPVFVHHDYKEANTVMLRDGERWRLGGVFDLIEAYFGDPEEDFAKPVMTYGPRNLERAREFIRGYVSLREPRSGFKERFRLYMLRDCLLIWEFGHEPTQGWFSGASFRKWAEPFVGLDVFPVTTGG
jgi:aminoglycoside phosphotransferase (APT) family kinase protein